MSLPRRLPVWIWMRCLDDAGLCRACGRQKWGDRRWSGVWTVCPHCDRNPDTPTPPNYQ